MIKVLIIDDDQAITKYVKTCLEALGSYQVNEASSGQKGIWAAKNLDPDIIFLDVMLPDIPGSDVAARLKEDLKDSKTPIVFMTGIISPEETRQSEGVIGNEIFLAKPFTRGQMTDCIERYARRR